MFRNASHRMLMSAAAVVAGSLAAPAAGNPADTVTTNPADTVTTNPAAGDAATATAATGEKPKGKRGKGAAGISVFGPFNDIAAALADATTHGKRFTAYTVKIEGKPDRYFSSNHRNAVQHKVMTADGYTIVSGNGENRGGRKPADPAKRADELLAGMSDAERAALLSKYLGTGNAAAAVSELPAAPARQDTTPAAEFDAAKTPATAGKPAGVTPEAAAKLNAGKPTTGKPVAKK